MKECKKCGRPLMEYEDDLCPFCECSRSHAIKHGLQVAAGVGIIGYGGYKVVEHFNAKEERKKDDDSKEKKQKSNKNERVDINEKPDNSG
ncbi:hypothetical protein MTBBW1_2500019 [Desulfamplus magnetovallimortis]|uniref:Uncharacterized protein n=1 Tax=Desulfamplus magnetovallimortis TaxID=1246637 RepID=A0A1W1HEH5_9BACT|nr:hypothetical protein [Desulfamplus magnetovallimortis]SLM30870.1 hypothetical protein MTBBW1_2500019 [Desulfamplus magnetovallimortis]